MVPCHLHTDKTVRSTVYGPVLRSSRQVPQHHSVSYMINQSQKIGDVCMVSEPLC